jgi:DNA mismatch repair protein MutS
MNISIKIVVIYITFSLLIKLNHLNNYIIFRIIMSKSIFEEYLFYQEKYTKKYGSNTIVLMQVGSFHECYATNDRGFNLHKLSEILNLICTRKDKSIVEVSINNPNLVGFPSLAIEKYLKILVDNKMTVVVIDQVTPPPKPKREVTRIVSAGTYITDVMSPEANYIMSVFLEEELINGKIVMCAGMSVIDLSTGENYIHEAYNNTGDDKYPLDEIVRFINSYHPNEILITLKRHSEYDKNNKLNNRVGHYTKQQLIMYLELEKTNFNFVEKVDPKVIKLSYQKQLLERVFNDTGLLGVFEHLDLENMPYARFSYVLMLDFAFQHDEKIINFIYKPQIFDSHKHLILGNDAIHQLNVFENQNQESLNSQFKSLFDLVNKTSTPMGKRLLRNNLIAPYTSEKYLNTRYAMTQRILDKNMSDKLNLFIKEIPDLERIQRKLALQRLHPSQFVDMLSSYKTVLELINIVKNDKILKKILPSDKIIQEINQWINDCEKQFNIDEMKKYHLNEIYNSFYKIGVNQELDNLQQEINDIITYMDQICVSLSGLIDEQKIQSSKSKIKKIIENENNDNNEIDKKVYLVKNDTEGYHLKLTETRAKLLKERLNNKPLIINNIIIDTKTFEFRNFKGGTKLTFADLRDKSQQLVELRTNMMNQIQDIYLKYLGETNAKYSMGFHRIVEFISLLDVIKSSAVVAKLYNYTKPELINNNKNSFIDCRDLRHPIVERINTSVEYIPNDVKIGNMDDNNIDGMLIYGLNSAGKSTIMKAIGLSVIMAQSGMFVPASSFRFSPYRYIFARVTSNDNIFKGLSSFTLEMTELKAILKRASPHTLIIGDEICKGTEHTSGLAIVSSALIKLAKTNASFIFATHLHELADMDRIRQLPNIKTYHLTVQHDQKTDQLIFDRKLKEGSGDKIYGVLVAKHIIDDTEFISLAQEIKNEILNQPNKIIDSDKISRYNKKIIMDKCLVCGKQTKSKNNLINEFDTHHINHQKDCIDGFVKNKPHLSMNSEANLIVLCKLCHYKVHHDQIEITGYKETSKGRQLEFRHIEK